MKITFDGICKQGVKRSVTFPLRNPPVVTLFVLPYIVTSRTDFKLGNILEDGLEELFLNHHIMKNLRNGNIEVCGNCRFYKKCGGDRNASFVAYGSFLKKDPGCWFTNNTEG